MPDYSTKRLLERKKRDIEAREKEQRTADETAKLQKKMELLKKEAQKRKKRQRQQDEDDLADILGMPKPSEKKKK